MKRSNKNFVLTPLKFIGVANVTKKYFTVTFLSTHETYMASYFKD